MFNLVSKYYDYLVKDDAATKMWHDFYNKHKNGNKTLELASGSGEISLLIAQNDQLDVNDLSLEMLDIIKEKDHNKRVNNYYHFDMKDFNINKKYDNIVCFCDSVNYLTKVSDLKSFFQSVSNHLEKDGIFMFDMHHIDRLLEFSDEYLEVGHIYDDQYQWSIISEDDYIIHNFTFYVADNTYFEQHIQKVYKVEEVLKLLEDLNFEVKIYTDFINEGVVAGEKIFMVGKKL